MRLLALPAELYPQMWERTFIKFCEGCVTASTGLPGELHPQKLSAEIFLLTTFVIIANHSMVVNCFLKFFAKQCMGTLFKIRT